jgi:hypothetical protein
VRQRRGDAGVAAAERRACGGAGAGRRFREEEEKQCEADAWGPRKG